MNKALLLFFLFITVNLFSESIDTEKYDNIIHMMFTDLSEVIKNGNKNKNVEDVYNLALESFNKHAFNLSIDPSKKTILDGMSFDFHKDSTNIDLSYGTKFLDTYRKGSTIHLSILIHEMRHLYDYTNSPDLFKASKENIKEEYWYELDAMHVEAEFIKYYLTGYDLSLFEKFLASSFEEDNLDSISVFMKKERMNVFFYFNSIQKRYFDDKDSRDRILDEIVSNGNSWIEYYKSIDRNDQYMYFICYITINSYQRFMMPTIATIMENPSMTWSDVYKKYPNIEILYNNLREIVNNDFDTQMQYLQKIYDYWEEDFMKKINV